MFCKYCGYKLMPVNGKCQVCGHELLKLEGNRNIFEKDDAEGSNSNLITKVNEGSIYQNERNHFDNKKTNEFGQEEYQRQIYQKQIYQKQIPSGNSYVKDSRGLEAASREKGYTTGTVKKMSVKKIVICIVLAILLIALGFLIAPVIDKKYKKKNDTTETPTNTEKATEAEITTTEKSNRNKLKIVT